MQNTACLALLYLVSMPGQHGRWIGHEFIQSLGMLWTPHHVHFILQITGRKDADSHELYAELDILKAENERMHADCMLAHGRLSAQVSLYF